MPLDGSWPSSGGGSDCWRCSGLGWWTQPLSPAEVGDILPDGAKFIAGHVTIRCQECSRRSEGE